MHIFGHFLYVCVFLEVRVKQKIMTLRIWRA